MLYSLSRNRFQGDWNYCGLKKRDKIKMGKKLKGPWYSHKDYWVKKATAYINKGKNISNKPIYRREANIFMLLNNFRVIFESNLIEGAGLSEGETRKVIENHFPRLPTDFDSFRGLHRLGKLFSINSVSQLRKTIKVLELHGLDPKIVRPSILMKGKSRGFFEVAQHQDALLTAILKSSQFTLAKLDHLLYKMMVDKSASKEKSDKLILKEIREKFQKKRFVVDFERGKMRPRKKLLTEIFVKKLHKKMAMDLLPSDTGVKSGEYRIDNRIIGWDILFPSPYLIPKCMKEFIKRSDVIVEKSFYQRLNLFQAAAEVSYDFVSIHPFPDFNGRLSRIIMNMVLIANGCPFPIALRGISKEKHRYFTALKRANRGDMESLTCLIAMRVAKTYEELDKNLKKAGLKSILSIK